MTDDKFLDLNSFIKYVNSFKNVYLWGAGNLGTAIGKFFIENKLIFKYWDKQFFLLNNINGVEVEKPFTSDCDKNQTLVISCISNSVLRDNWPLTASQNEGFKHVIKGMNIYQTFICPFTNESNVLFDPSVCIKRPACNIPCCSSFLNRIKGGNDDALIVRDCAIFITQRCNMKCKHCNQYYNELTVEQKIDVPFEQIKSDLDVLSETFDYIGSMAIIGGEACLHPHYIEIVQYALDKKNIGIVWISTNGTVRLKEGEVAQLKNDRFFFSFSDYKAFLSERQMAIYNENIKVIKNLGITYRINSCLWRSVSPLEDSHMNENELINFVNKCDPARNFNSHPTFDGRYYLCANMVHAVRTGLSGCEEDFVDLRNKKNLRERMLAFLSQKYWGACRYCYNPNSTFVPAGEQA